MPVHVPFVSVRFADATRPEEMAYRDGAFVHPYLDSTRVGDTFSLRRAGGWPAAPTVHVEAGSGPAVATWQPVYSVNFAALPPATFATTGAHEIGDATWWLKGGFTGGHTTALDGTGLRIRSPFGSEGSDTATLRWFLPLANVEGFDPAAPLAIWARVSTTDSFFLSNAVVGVAQAAASGASFSPTERETRVGLGTAGTAATYVTGWIHDTSGDANHTLNTAPSGLLLGLQRLSPTTSRFMVAPYASPPPDPGGPSYINAVAHWARSHAAVGTANLGVYFSHNFNGGSTQDFYLRDLFVMQPRAA
jgi:hypothetical protein